MLASKLEQLSFYQALKIIITVGGVYRLPNAVQTRSIAAHIAACIAACIAAHIVLHSFSLEQSDEQLA
jgi:hypothetical protein